MVVKKTYNKVYHFNHVHFSSVQVSSVNYVYSSVVLTMVKFLYNFMHLYILFDAS